MQNMFKSNVDHPLKFEFIGPASRCTAREVLLWPLRPTRVCWSSAARKAASSFTFCLLRALRWPLPPYRLPPQLALPQQGAESKSPQKRNDKSHWFVPLTATFSKRRKIGALWTERCDDYDAVDPVSLLIEEARQALFNSKGPCGKSCAKTDRDLHAWLTSWLPSYAPSACCWQ